MGVFKRSRAKQHNNFMGRSLIRNKLRQKEESENMLYSKIGNDESTIKVSKKISILNKDPLDDYLDNQLVINDVQVSKVFLQKNEIKEKKEKNIYPNTNQINLNVHNIVLPVPGRPFFLNNQDKINIILNERENTIQAKKKKKKRKNVKQITFLMSGKSLIPINVRSSKNETSKKKKIKNSKCGKMSGRGVPEAEHIEQSEEEQHSELEEQEQHREQSEEEQHSELEEQEQHREQSEEEQHSELEEQEQHREQSEEEQHSELAEQEHHRITSPVELPSDEPRNEPSSGHYLKGGKYADRLTYDLKYVHMYEERGKRYREEGEGKRVLNKESIDKYELEYFIEWRKVLSDIEEKEGYILTPYEKNIEYWKQLWRVIEKSHVIFYIIDARNPLFFYCKGLEYYIKRVDKRKEFIIILNKSDFLNYEQRKIWSEYFEQRNVKFIFFSALRELYNQNMVLIRNYNTTTVMKQYNHMHMDNDELIKRESNEKMEGVHYYSLYANHFCQDDALPNDDIKDQLVNIGYGNLNYERKKNDNTDILSVNDLIFFIKNIKMQIKELYHDIELETFSIPRFMVGFVGFPNVGKSSIINSLIGEKKVSVSPQPGKTKHFQTVPLKNLDFSVCDCPGLIFPTLVFNKYDLFINGVCSIDHFKGNFVHLVQILCNIIPEQLCDHYKINKNVIHKVVHGGGEGHEGGGVGRECKHSGSSEKSENGKEKTYLFLDAMDFLRSFCTARKYVSGGKGGLLNFNVATRQIIRDFIAGNLQYNFMPSYLSENASFHQRMMERTPHPSCADVPLFSDFDSQENVLTTKRKFRYMQKQMMKGKNFLKCCINV
ncbi:large ribosomal subunit associated GTPase, putative [Plasmodium malariae]|uniref:Large ribosomal subunit associated GTPase, putative n=2 Tax=Plasmodium malariae TaxID=5858 RepID=A0A1C3KEY5_PLAMA|nr:large ribosomal subunit associated GTPase, putative [Plasmodium malariae]